jgi:hypothetical protein
MLVMGAVLGVPDPVRVIGAPKANRLPVVGETRFTGVSI